MKTWVVLPNPVDGRCWMGNAESAEEAAMYARGKGDLVADAYVVWDWDANRHAVVYREVVSDDGSDTRSSDAPGRPGG